AHDIVSNPPLWVDALGERPDDSEGQRGWVGRAGVVAGYREAFGITTPDDPIGPPPPEGRPDAHAWWVRAAAALTNSEARTLAALPSERLEAIVEAAHAHLGDAPPPLADQLRRSAIALRQTHTRQGSATAQGDTAAARAAGAEAARLTRQLTRLEVGQALRERWSLTAARLDAQAGAAQAVLDARQAAQRARPYTLLDNATLVRRLRGAQRRAQQARSTAERYDQEGERAHHSSDRRTPARDRPQRHHRAGAEPSPGIRHRRTTSRRPHRRPPNRPRRHPSRPPRRPRQAPVATHRRA
ncbi:MAG: hypothetical protein ACYC1D_16595, partial [Acidimicrobiales bacterium]